MDRKNELTSKKSRDIERTIYTDWANHHLEKTGVKRLIQDLPKDISDGLLLADIVHFVCGQNVERIHAKPSTTKQKIHNIDRCLQVLEANNVVLNDVTAQGIYRCELKCVLALFFHLSRYKQKAQDFKMADGNRPLQRRGLKPPSALSVTRKSRSFNANDRNRINGELNGIPPPSIVNKSNIQQPSHQKVTSLATNGTSGWRSKSMSAKHSATTRLVPPKNHASHMQTFKPNSNITPRSSNPSSSQNSLVSESSLVGTNEVEPRKITATPARLGSPSRLRTPRRPISTTMTNSIDNKPKTNGLSVRSVSSKERSPSTIKTATKTIPKRASTVKPTSPIRTKTSALKSGVEQTGKLPSNGTKSSSVMSRLRRLGTPTDNAPTTVPKTRSTSLSKSSVNSTTVSPGSGLKKRSESVPPTSRLSTNLSRPSIVKKETAMDTDKAKSGKLATGKSLKSPSGLKSVKSTIGKAFGASKQVDKKNSKVSSPSVSGKTAEGLKSKLVQKSSTQKGGKLTDKPGITISNPIPHIISPPKEDDKLANVIFTELPTFSQPNDVTTSNCSTPSCDQPPPLPPKDNPPASMKPEPMSVGLSRIHKPHLTATVAPFMRHSPLGSGPNLPIPVNHKRPDSIIKNKMPEANQNAKEKAESKTSAENVSNSETDGHETEARQKAVMGIANLRQNLEDTMCSLRSTQLRHKNGDAFQRRISAQLDGVEFDHLSDISPISRSSNIYRSHHNLLGSQTTPRPRSNYQVNGSNEPKLHAGETMGEDVDYKFGPGRFCSLQRTRSARGPRPAWHDVTPVTKAEGNQQAGSNTDNKGYVSDGGLTKTDSTKFMQNWEALDSADDISSVSSGDISDCIADISTDELSSNNNSPFHQIKSSTAPSTPASNTETPVMAIENAGSKIMKRKGLGKPPSGKIGLPSGSNAVGSRLACNIASMSPAITNSPLQNIVGNQRGNVAYRSLPRPTKNKFMDDRTKSPLANETSSTLNHANRKSETFKRSPSLQKLLGFSKPNQNVNDQTDNMNETENKINQFESSTKDNIFNDNDKLIIKPMPDFTTADRGTLSKNRELGHYNTLGRPKKSSTNGNKSTSPLSYLSLPRKSSPRNYLDSTNPYYPDNDTHNTAGHNWASPKRQNANRAYSISPSTDNPFASIDLLTTPSLYLDEKESSNLNEKFKDENGFANGRNHVSDWPLPTLMSTNNMSSSNNNGVRPGSRASSYISGNSPDENYHHSSMFSLDSTQHKSNLISNRAQSLMSSTPSLYSLPEDNVPPMKIQMERENGIHSSSAKMVSVFEQSLSTMNNRLRELSVSAEEKDTELQELRNTIENLKKTQSPEDCNGLEDHPALRKKASCGSLSSISSKTSMSSMGSTEDGLKFRKKKNWGMGTGEKLRSSIKTAFAKRKSRPNLSSEFDEMEENNLNNEKEDSDVVAKLKEELLNKERKLTDIRLEALTSQHQLHQMQDAMQKMRNEMETLRQQNYQLKQLGRSTMSLNVATSPYQTERPASTISFSSDILMRDSSDTKITIICEFAEHLIDDETNDRKTEKKVVLAVCYIPRSAGWLQLDHTVQQAFQNYCLSIDPSGSLGLTAESVSSYNVGEANRLISGEAPALLPCGYIVGDVDTISVNLGEGNGSAIESLALELLIERETLEKYVKLLLEHGRVMLCGPAGTGKTTLANRLAEYVVQGTSKRLGKGAIVRLDVKNRTENEIREYLYQLSEDCSKPESCGREIPVVLVIDDLRVSSSLNEAFQPLLTTSAHSQLPYLIGVVRQDHGSGLQLHHEFRWIMCSNHAPPVSNFLARSLRRSLTKIEIANAEILDEEITAMVNWLPKCWQHVNKYIESYNSADVTLGPRIFCACPINGNASRVWFTDLWNFSIVPYIISAVKQGHSKGKMWKDPVQWIKESWPWATPCDLHSIRAEDVALDNSTMVPTDNSTGTQPSDPLLNMLIKLQEAATNYESDNSHDDAFERSVDRALGELS